MKLANNNRTQASNPGRPRRWFAAYCRPVARRMASLVTLILFGLLSGMAGSAQAGISLGGFWPTTIGESTWDLLLDPELPGPDLPPPAPPDEEAPRSPMVWTRWKTPDSIKIQFRDDSEVEDGFDIEQQTASGHWTRIAGFGPAAGNYLLQDHVVSDLEPETDYCFRVVAYNDLGMSRDIEASRTCTRTTAPGACDSTVIEDVLELAHDDAESVHVQCDLTLEPNQVVTKQLKFVGNASSNLTLDLNGARLNGGAGTYHDGSDILQVYSKEVVKEDDSNRISRYERVENVTIRNGEIHGGIRVFGMAGNGQGDGDFEWVRQCYHTGGQYVCQTVKVEIPYTNQLKKSSRLPGHTARVRAAAPTNITFEDLRIVGHARIPLYLAPGVTHTKLLNSTLLGKSNSVAIYLDAESGHNEIRNNNIDVETKDRITNIWDRPQIAVDGSSHNRIYGNRFSNLQTGGIWLYRNCGEGGVIRHETPSYNQMINNRFFYVSYDGDNPAIYLGARDRGGWTDDTFGFCDDDDGYELGSSADDGDFARHNVVMQNQFYVRSVNESIDSKNWSQNQPNYRALNTSVTEETVELGRPSGCYLGTEPGGFMEHDEVVVDTLGECLAREHHCEDGVITSTTDTACPYVPVETPTVYTAPTSEGTSTGLPVYGGSVFSTGTTWQLWR